MEKKYLWMVWCVGLKILAGERVSGGMRGCRGWKRAIVNISDWLQPEPGCSAMHDDFGIKRAESETTESTDTMRVDPRQIDPRQIDTRQI